MRSPLFSAFIYLILGIVFTYFAIQQVTISGWGFFTYLLILLATLDFGAFFRLVSIHFKIKKKQNTNHK